MLVGGRRAYLWRIIGHGDGLHRGWALAESSPCAAEEVALGREPFGALKRDP